MKKVGIFYGSETGTTADIAQRIAKSMGVDEENIFNVGETSPTKLGDYDVLLLGSSTWGDGDMASDWYDFMAGAAALSLQGKTVAIFGCGDESYSDTFCNAIGKIKDGLEETGAKFVGRFNTDGYDFVDSDSLDDGAFVGLAIDETNHPDFTDRRIDEWTKQVKEEAGL